MLAVKPNDDKDDTETVRQFLSQKPGTILMVGLLLMAWGLFTTYFLLSIAYGGFLYEPTLVQVIGFGLTGGAFLAGLVLALFAGYRRCRSVTSN